MPFAELDGNLIATFGKAAIYTPAAASEGEAVTVIESDSSSPTDGALKTVFGTLAESGFSQVPAKGDAFEIAGVTYRIFTVEGPDQIGGIHIGLTR